MSTKEEIISTKVSTVIQTHTMRRENYEWDIKVAPNLMTSDIMTSSFAATCDFSAATTTSPGPAAALTACMGLKFAPVTINIDRLGKKLYLTFRLPQYVHRYKKMEMKSFEMLLFTKGEMFARFVQDAPVKQPQPQHLHPAGGDKANVYLQMLDFSEPGAWKEIDTIKIIWDIVVEEERPNIHAVKGTTMEDLEKNNTIPTLQQSLSQFYGSDSFSDVIISCEGQDFPANRLILAMSSPVFKRIFETDMKQKKEGRLEIAHMKKHTLRLVLEWIYTGKIDAVDLQQKVDLFKAAHRYEIASLSTWCLVQIPLDICAENALEMYKVWSMYKEKTLLQKTLQVMRTEKEKLFKNLETFKEFTAQYPEVMFQLMQT